jgi:arylsulfatase A-like enzyme
VYAEHGRDGILRETEFMTLARSRAWKLVHFMDELFGQLFDLESDPGETHNLWDDPTAAGKKQELLDTLREWRIRSQYHTRAWAQAWR